MAWEWRENNREKVLGALRRGEYEAILASREGALDALTHLACELEVLEAAELIEVEREREGIPDEVLMRTLAILPFVEALSLSAAANTLFEDAAVLLQLGYTAIQIQEGFNQRRGKQYEKKSAQSRPYHGDVLRGELQRIKVESLDAYRRHCVEVLYQPRLLDRVRETLRFITLSQNRVGIRPHPNGRRVRLISHQRITLQTQRSLPWLDH
jgi:hypothetical protein